MVQFRFLFLESMFDVGRFWDPGPISLTRPDKPLLGFPTDVRDASLNSDHNAENLFYYTKSEHTKKNVTKPGDVFEKNIT